MDENITLNISSVDAKSLFIVVCVPSVCLLAIITFIVICEVRRRMERSKVNPNASDDPSTIRWMYNS